MKRLFFNLNQKSCTQVYPGVGLSSPVSQSKSRTIGHISSLLLPQHSPPPATLLLLLYPTTRLQCWPLSAEKQREGCCEPFSSSSLFSSSQLPLARLRGPRFFQCQCQYSMMGLFGAKVRANCRVEFSSTCLEGCFQGARPQRRWDLPQPRFVI